MASNPSSQPGNTPPPKPWERAGTSSGPAPFKPPSSGSTSDVVEASGTAKPGDVTNAQRSTAMNTNTVGRPLPSRPWEQNNGSTYGGYGGMTTNNSGYNSGMYSSYGGYGGGGGAYGGGLYGNNMYNRGYSGMYGGNGMGGGMYGGSMYNNGMASPMGGYGMGMGGPGMGMGGPYGNQDPNNPYGSPPSPPGFWMSFMHVMQGVVNFFGRISVLIDQNTQAFHMFMSALLQLFDRSGVLYGELARFVLRILGVKTKPRKQPGPGEHPGPDGFPSINGQGQHFIEGPKVPSGSWDNVWGDDGIRGSS